MNNPRTTIPFSKRALDVAVSVSALIVFAPILAALALWIKLVSAGPVLYVARRVGFRGRVFGQLKLRTMRVGADRHGSFTARNDPRIIPGGGLIRILRFDEIPQFINVIRGEMSVVGPRPEDVETVERNFTEHYRKTFDTLPGLTGIRQLRLWPDCDVLEPAGIEDPQQYYLDVILPYSIELDLEYVRGRSLRLDLRLIAATVWAIGVRSWWQPLFGGKRLTPESVLDVLPAEARRRAEIHLRPLTAAGAAKRKPGAGGAWKGARVAHS